MTSEVVLLKTPALALVKISVNGKVGQMTTSLFYPYSAGRGADCAFTFSEGRCGVGVQHPPLMKNILSSS